MRRTYSKERANGDNCSQMGSRTRHSPISEAESSEVLEWILRMDSQNRDGIVNLLPVDMINAHEGARPQAQSRQPLNKLTMPSLDRAAERRETGLEDPLGLVLREAALECTAAVEALEGHGAQLGHGRAVRTGGCAGRARRPSNGFSEPASLPTDVKDVVAMSVS